MEEEPINTNELNSELTGLNKGEKEKKLKQLIIYTSSGTLILIILIVLIIVLTQSKDSDSDSDSKKNIIGEINCIYDIRSFKTKLFGDEFEKDSNFDIYIDGRIIKYSKEYTFDSITTHNVQIKLFGDLNMDYMFKDVADLIEVRMESENNFKILSMISTFQNCENLNFFNISGFNVEEVKSTKKLFYNTSLSEVYFNDFNSINLVDMSYMFFFFFYK